MVEKNSFLSRLLFIMVFAAICGGTILGLLRLNEAMEIRYQTVGIVTDATHTPLEGVEVLLLLAPPPSTGTELDSAFRRNAIAQGRLSTDGQAKQPVGPIIGLSGPKGVFLIRTAGRTGAARAIRMGLDSEGRPPFEMGWLVLRKEGYQDTVTTISLLGWRTAPKNWGKFANRLPRAILKKIEREKAQNERGT